MIYGSIQTLIAFGFGISFLINGDLSESFNPSWFLGARNMAIVSVLAFGLIARNPAFIFAGFQLRFVVDLLDMINNAVAAPSPGETLYTAAFFVFLSLIPLAWGMRVLWRIMNASDE
jgi:hypothetical protein